MYCTQCGAQNLEAHLVCPACGTVCRKGQTCETSQRAGQPTPKRLMVVAALWLIYSLLYLNHGFALLFLSKMGSVWSVANATLPHATEWWSQWMRGRGIASLAFAVAGLVAAFAIYERKSWARVVGLALSAAALLQIPFGTIVGVCTLWILLPHKARSYFVRAVAGG